MQVLKKLISRPTVNELRERIDEVRRIKLANADIDFLKERLEFLTRGYTVHAPVLAIGQRVYRGVLWNTKPTNTSHLHHPPAERVQRLGRANRIGVPRFYCSVGRPAPFYELPLSAGDFVALSQWELKDKIFANIAGYKEFVFKELGSKRKPEQYEPYGTHPALNSPANRLVADFLAKEFTKIVHPDNEHEYKLSIAIAEKLMGNVVIDGTFPTGVPTSSDMGLLYPSISMWGNSDNLVLKPETVESHLRLVNVEYVRIDEVGEQQFQVTYIDFANSFGPNGEIEWKGRLPQWRLQSQGEILKVIVEDGHWVARTLDGKLVDPD
jgi:hypothetical protein